MFQKDMRLALLLDYYGDLLGEQRRSIMELYYCEDFSLSEIAEHTGVTRQAVRDSIKKGEAELYRFDEALHLADRMQSVRDRSQAAAQRLSEILAALPDGELYTSLSALKRAVEDIPG